MKHWYESKTLWFNVLTITAAASGVVLQYVEAFSLTEAQTALAGMTATMVNTLGNIYLRMITTTGIK